MVKNSLVKTVMPDCLHPVAVKVEEEGVVDVEFAIAIPCQVVIKIIIIVVI